MQGFCALFVGHQQLIERRVDVAREGWFLSRHEVVDECGQGLVAQSRFDAAIFFPNGSGDDNFGGHDSWMVLERVVRARHASGGVDLGLVIEPLWEVCFASAKVGEGSRKCKFLSNYFLAFSVGCKRYSKC